MLKDSLESLIKDKWDSHRQLTERGLQAAIGIAFFKYDPHTQYQPTNSNATKYSQAATNYTFLTPKATSTNWKWKLTHTSTK